MHQIVFTYEIKILEVTSPDPFLCYDAVFLQIYWRTTFKMLLQRTWDDR